MGWRKKKSEGLALPGDAGPKIARLLNDLSEVCEEARDNDQLSRNLANVLIRAIRCVVEQYRLQALLRDIALTDELTGLHNRRGFLTLAEYQLRLARRSHHGLLLLYADLDGLKQINDRLGHEEGDRALISVADVLRKTFRDSDILARLGGDQFAVLAGEASNWSETTIAKRLQANLEARNASASGYTLSLSAGFAHFSPRSRLSLEDLMSGADAAMYQQKRERRLGSRPDRVVSTRASLGPRGMSASEFRFHQSKPAPRRTRANALPEKNGSASRGERGCPGNESVS